MNAHTRIREGTRDDLDIVLYHRRQMFLEMGYSDDDQMAASQHTSREFFSRALDQGTYKPWFAETDAGRVVAGGGIVLTIRASTPVHPELQRAEILNVYTEPAFRRKGLASQLMVIMIDWCRTKGFSFVALHASAAGRPLYESLGFKPTREMRLDLREVHP